MRNSRTAKCAADDDLAWSDAGVSGSSLCSSLVTDADVTEGLVAGVKAGVVTVRRFKLEAAEGITVVEDSLLND